MMVKRLFDVVLSALLLAATSPLCVFVAILVKLSSRGPVFFRQVRAGRVGRPFTLIKFRTMREARDRSQRLLPDAQRLTTIGRLLRATSLDELPELVNVLRGEMSLVGPRPLLIQYLDRYTAEQNRRHEVKPGLTGWAQIHGRNNLTWEEKFGLDVWYVDHWSLSLDAKVLAMTAWKTFRREGIREPGEATAREFMGSES